VRNPIVNILLLVCLGALASNSSSAQTKAEASANDASSHASQHRGDRLKMVVILSRHGVRSPTWTLDRLNAYSAQPWPQWSVPPGDLTRRGFQLMKQFGSYDLASLAEADLLATDGCEDASKTYIWADTDQRTLESGRALAEGLFPNCPPAIHSLAPAKNDPLFHPHSNGMSAMHSDAALVPSDATAKREQDSQQDELLSEMQHVLRGCDAKIACTPTQTPAIPLLGAAASIARDKKDQMSEAQDSLGLASSFAEDFLLEYAEGMPMDQVGWGKVDEVQLRSFLALHTANFARTHGTQERAKAEASTMLFHVTRTLQQGAERHSVAGAIGPANSKLVLLVGHDTNLAGVAALLGLHWTLDGREDDTPPGTELAFELWQNVHGAYSVRVTVAMQTLRQMREMQAITAATPPAQKTLTLSGCDVDKPICEWKTFLKIADHAIDKNSVLPASAN
jgi:4-phytase/acid phosphatase